MKKTFILIAMLSIGMYACKKSDDTSVDPNLPSITTTAVTAISTSGAVSGGNVTAQGFDSVTSRGVCWSTNPSPTITDSKTSNGSSTGTFTSLLNSLAANTTYYVRAFATNSKGTGYGNQLSFKTTAITVDTTQPYIFFDLDGVPQVITGNPYIETSFDGTYETSTGAVIGPTSNRWTLSLGMPHDSVSQADFMSVFNQKISPQGTPHDHAAYASFSTNIGGNFYETEKVNNPLPTYFIRFTAIRYEGTANGIKSFTIWGDFNVRISYGSTIKNATNGKFKLYFEEAI